MFLLSRTACATVHHHDPDLGSNRPSRSSFQPDNQTGSPYPSDEKRPHDEINLTMFLYLTLVGGVRVCGSAREGLTLFSKFVLEKKLFSLTSVVSPVDEEVLSAEDTLSTLIKQRRSYCQTKFIDITEHFYLFVLYHPCTFSSHEKTL